MFLRLVVYHVKQAFLIAKMAKLSPKKWVFTCLLLLLVACNDTRCQKEDISSDSQQSIDEAERREGKPQDSGNGKDTRTIFLYRRKLPM